MDSAMATVSSGSGKAIGDRVIDCDIHPEVPNTQSLLPYMQGHWQDIMLQRDMMDFRTYNYPPKAPLSARPDWRPANGQKAATSISSVRSELLDPFGVDIAICNSLFGIQMLQTEDLASALCRAHNDFVAKEWLGADDRLRSSIVVPALNPALAVEEIERLAPDSRFVQVLMLVSGEHPLGKKFYWPIYAAAERFGLPVCVHAGSAFRYPLSPAGSTSFYFEDYASQAYACQAQLVSLVAEGVFVKFPALRIVFAESGVSWLSGLCTRFDKFWHGLRLDIPWIKVLPSEIVRNSIRMTVQPFDCPDAATVHRLLDHLGSDEILLFSTDYPHWHFDGTDALPPGLSSDMVRKIKVENPAKTYARI
jgi:predicted TIM-barrel fold metal-dependent hydrolase